MGCDIHLFVEYRNKNYDQWRPWGSQFHLDRNYTMFGYMAEGVRNYFDDAFELRGMPEDAAYSSKYDNLKFICDDEKNDEYVTSETAKRWVENHGCEYVDNKWVTHPDWHSHSWLTAGEFEECINKCEDYTIEYKAVLAAMRSLESDGDNITRIVFWFDN